PGVATRKEPEGRGYLMAKRQPSRCTVCSSGERAAIELGMARGMSYARLSKRFGVSSASIGRHRRGGHVPEAMRNKQAAIALAGSAASLETLRRDESEGLLSHLVGQRSRLYAILDEAEQEDLKIAATIHARITSNLDLEARLLDQIGGRATIVNNSLIIEPSYLRLRQALLNALAPSQLRAARLAVVAALRAVETAEPSDEPLAIDATATTEEPIESSIHLANRVEP